MQAQGVACDPVQSLGWGLLTAVALPGGGTVGVYQTRHVRPQPMPVRDSGKKPVRLAKAPREAARVAKPKVKRAAQPAASAGTRPAARKPPRRKVR